MTSKRTDQSYGIPAPVTELTVEQDLKMRTTEDGVRKNYESEKEAIITYLLALQHQNFILGNSITNLVKKWPPPPTQSVPNTTNGVLPMFGILLGNNH